MLEGAYMFTEKVNMEFLAELRILVGYLGEKSQYNWWTSSFFGAGSQTFLRPVFARTSLLAQYHGVKEAAAKIHDEYIGVGRGVYHLFRLPEGFEQKLHSLVIDESFYSRITPLLNDKETALSALSQYAATRGTSAEGPIHVGSVEDLERKEVWQTAAGHYRNAFESGKRAFPFFMDQ